VIIHELVLIIIAAELITCSAIKLTYHIGQIVSCLVRVCMLTYKHHVVISVDNRWT